jgi:RHS repeat-associated protein
MKIIHIVSLAIAATFLAATDSQAKYCDDETDLVYYGYRYYNPTAGRWLSRDPLGEEAFLTQFIDEHQDWNDDEIDTITREALKPCYVLLANNPVNGFDQFGLDGRVPDCSIIIYFGHNYSVPQGIIYAGVCSAAAVVSCGKSKHSNPGIPTKQIPGTSPTPPGQSLTIGAAADIAYDDFLAGVAYAKTRCANPGCWCKCSTITVTVEFSFGMDRIGAWAANINTPSGYLSGLTQTIPCGAGSGRGVGGTSGGAGAK